MFSDLLYRLNPNATVQPEYLTAFIGCRAARLEIESLIRGASGLAKKLTQFDVANITLPPLPEQHAIVAHIATETAKLDALRSSAERTIALLKERRSALISAAVTGKIAISESRA